MKKNILFVVDERMMGGVSVLLEDIINMLNLNKYNIDVLVLHNNGNMLENLPKCVNIIYGTPYFEAIDYTAGGVIKKHHLNLLLKKIRVVLDMKLGTIKNSIKKERKKILNKTYDVEIAFKDGFTALFTAFGNSKKKIHWLHYEYKVINPNGKYDRLFKMILPKFDTIVAVSNNVKMCFNDIYALGDKVIVINNVINQEKIKIKAQENSDMVFSKDELNLVSVGRLHHQKGYERLIMAMGRLKEENLLTNIKLRIYGNGPLYDNLNCQIKKLSLANNVFLMGQVMNPYKYIKDCDLFVLSSLYEPFGLVMVESMTLSVPVLATKNAATSELIDNDVNGLIIENSIDGIYNGLKNIILNRELIKKYKKNLKNYVYDNKKLINKIEQILDR